jgi:DNA-binding transcriptional LysR family regulator
MTRPDVRELECFVAVADNLNFSKAARQINLSQPPLTRHIQSLEEKLGSRLLDRNTHSVSLTNPGRLFLEDARAILSQLDRSAETLRRAREGEKSRIRLAFIGALLDELLVGLIQRFRHTSPQCQVQMADLSPAAQLEALQNGSVDGGFIGAHPSRGMKGLQFEIWHREPFVLIAPKNHPLTKIPRLEWRHLRNLPWVMVSQLAAPAFRRQFSGLANRHALAARIVQESERMPAVLTMVAAGSGVTMVPRSAARLVSRGVVLRQFPDPPPFLDHSFAYRADSTSAHLRDFLALLRANRKE